METVEQAVVGHLIFLGIPLEEAESSIPELTATARSIRLGLKEDFWKEPTEEYSGLIFDLNRVITSAIEQDPARTVGQELLRKFRQRGMPDEDAWTAFKVVEPGLIQEMRSMLENPISDYPEEAHKILWVAVSPLISKWIEVFRPRAFYRGLF